MIYHNHVAVIGRVRGDDEDTCLMYEHLTLPAARQVFIDEMRRNDGITDEDIEAGHGEVYITHVLTSTSPMELT